MDRSTTSAARMLTAHEVAVTTHLFSKEPIFHRAFATGGTCLVRPALPAVVHEGTYQQVLTALGIEGLSGEERIKALLTLPMDEITAKLPPNVQPNAVVDGDIISASPSYASVMDPSDNSVPAKQWLKALAIGDSAFDVSTPLSNPRSEAFTNTRHRHPSCTG